MLIYPRGHYVSLNGDITPEESLPEDKEGRECLIPFRENSYVLFNIRKRQWTPVFVRARQSTLESHREWRSQVVVMKVQSE